jgi:hypothetical protein
MNPERFQQNVKHPSILIVKCNFLRLSVIIPALVNL